MKKVPDFYNNLEEIKKEIQSLLIRGVKDRKSNFHNIVFNTINLVNQPEARVVVLRGFCANEFSIKIHSDRRAKKIKEIKKNKSVCMVLYDYKKKIQLRVRGNATIDKNPIESWKKLSNWSRRCYLTINSPGLEAKKPTPGFPEEFAFQAPSGEQSEDGLKNFCVIKIFINQIEWLYLASQGHRRALLEISRINSKLKINAKWLTP